MAYPFGISARRVFSLLVLGVGLAAFTAAPASAADTTGKRLAIRMVAKCPSDPDPLGLMSDDMYSDCEQDELNKVKGWIAAALAANGGFGPIGDNNPDLILTVTMTQSQTDSGAAGMLTDFAPSTLKYTADYSLADTAGHTLQGGTVHHEDAQDYFGGNEDAVEQKFAEKIAASVKTALPAAQPAPPTPPRLGIAMNDLAPSLAEGLGHPGLTGVQVMQCLPGSAADKAGIAAGDILYEFDGKAVANKEGLLTTVTGEPAGALVSVKLLRGKQDMTLQVQF